MPQGEIHTLAHVIETNGLATILNPPRGHALVA
jgi:hypothetical protein